LLWKVLGQADSSYVFWQMFLLEIANVINAGVELWLMNWFLGGEIQRVAKSCHI